MGGWEWKRLKGERARPELEAWREARGRPTPLSVSGRDGTQCEVLNSCRLFRGFNLTGLLRPEETDSLLSSFAVFQIHPEKTANCPCA